MKLISLCGMNPLARQIIARGLDSASQFLAYCSRGEKQTGLYRSSRHYTWGLHQLQESFSPFQVNGHLHEVSTTQLSLNYKP